MRILVSGGAGFIASHITDRYVAEGHEVLVLDNLSSGKKENIPDGVTLIEQDLTDKKLVETIASIKPDIINHHAAQIEVRKSVEDPQNDARINILGTLNLLDAAEKAGSVKKIIFASTGGAIYGDADQVPTSESYLPQPLSPYGIAKLSSEHYLSFYQHVHSIPFVALRYANVYGPRQNPHGEAGVVAIFFERILQGKPFVINGDGTQTRDFVFVKDVVEANMKATFSDDTGIFNIGTGIETSINQLIGKMQEAIRNTQEIPHGPAKSGEQRRSCLNASKAERTWGWQPRFSLAEGLAQTADFFRTRV